MYKLIRQTTSLALLPANKIAEGYAFIKEQFDNTKYKYSARISKFFEYYEKQWLQSPDEFSVYRQRHRTNNSVESYHRTINNLMKKTPGIRKFSSKY